MRIVVDLVENGFVVTSPALVAPAHLRRPRRVLVARGADELARIATVLWEAHTAAPVYSEYEDLPLEEEPEEAWPPADVPPVELPAEPPIGTTATGGPAPLAVTHRGGRWALSCHPSGRAEFRDGRLVCLVVGCESSMLQADAHRAAGVA